MNPYYFGMMINNNRAYLHNHTPFPMGKCHETKQQCSDHDARHNVSGREERQSLAMKIAHSL